MNRRTKFRTILAQLGILALIQVSPTFAWAKRGGISDGGGNLCYHGSTPYLLEFSDLSAELKEPGVKVIPSRASELVGFGEFQELYKMNRLKERIDSILTANQASSPVVVSWLKQAVEGLQLSATTLPIAVPVAADLTQGHSCEVDNVRASILFFPPNYGFVDARQFNLLDLDSQAGLLIHEAGRVLQMIANGQLSGSVGTGRFTDKDLQKLVRTLFDVYRRGDDRIPTVDTQKLFDLMADQLLISPRFDLCLGDLTFNEAKARLIRTKMKSGERANIAREPHLDDIWAEQERIKSSLPKLYKDICKSSYEAMPWIDLKKKLEFWRSEIEAPMAGTSVPHAKEHLRDQIDRNLRHPTKSKDLRAAVTTAIPRAIKDFQLKSAFSQLALSWVFIGADTFFELKTDPWKSTAQEERLRSFERSACRIRENIRPYFRQGVLANAATKSGSSLPEILKQPHSHCGSSTTD